LSQLKCLKTGIDASITQAKFALRALLQLSQLWEHPTVNMNLTQTHSISEEDQAHETITQQMKEHTPKETDIIKQPEKDLRKRKQSGWN
jgi:hypothetical protein